MAWLYITLLYCSLISLKKLLSFIVNVNCGRESASSWPLGSWTEKGSKFSVLYLYFFLFFTCFWRPRGSFSLFSPLLPLTEFSPTKCHPRGQPTKRLVVRCGLRRRQIRTRDCRTTSLACNHWATTPLYQGATTPPFIEPPRLPEEPPHLSEEPPRLPIYIDVIEHVTGFQTML